MILQKYEKKSNWQNRTFKCNYTKHLKTRLRAIEQHDGRAGNGFLQLPHLLFQKLQGGGSGSLVFLGGGEDGTGETGGVGAVKEPLTIHVAVSV